jgi:Tfp pilus assembly protein PilN
MPFFDKNGNMVDADKVNLDDGFPTMQDLDELSKSKGKKLFSLLDKMSTTTIVLASVVVALLVVIVVLALKINSLSKEVTPLAKENKQLETPQTEYNKLDARVRKLEEAAKRKPQQVTASKKPNDQKKKQVR